MAIVLRCVDRWGREIRLTTDRWQGKILLDHAEMRGQEEAIRETLRNPMVVNFDVKYHRRRYRVENFYRRFVEAAPLTNLSLLKVCVRYRWDLGSGKYIGTILTAYATNKVKTGEKQRWP